eukprot:CAMPEP_0118826878 /NCGR_PEP_ID=MMETSP1162-20130426/12259_1 /TAXON_ID=33656 /ORGANISM="Phaeocystis Sp, Strain CCMP2710" /LENGTH=80 /DNA_ID=CAMNT_0006757623 /DNA_START=46 /DNA_END=284 /DNA_ORIENTATION=+
MIEMSSEIARYRPMDSPGDRGEIAPRSRGMTGDRARYGPRDGPGSAPTAPTSLTAPGPGHDVGSRDSPCAPADCPPADSP